MAGKAHSNPILQRKIRLKTNHAQRVHHRGFGRTSNSLHRVDVVLQIISDQKSVDEVEQIIDELFDQYLTDIGQEQARLASLLESNGITGEPEYTNPLDVSVEISSPQVSRLVRVLEQFENLVVAIDTLWLYGVFNNKQRKDSIYEWQRRSLRLGNRIVDIEKRAQRAAHNSGQDEEVAAKLGETGLESADEAEEDSDGSAADESDSTANSTEDEESEVRIAAAG